MNATAVTMPPFGDGTAPSDSVAFAVYARDQVNACLHSMRVDHEGLALYTKLLQDNKLFAKLQVKDGRTWRNFRSWTDFCQTARPYGLGRSPQDLQAIIAEAKDPQTIALQVVPLAKHGGDQKSETAKSILQRNVDRQGNSKEYLTARIARDHPTIHEDMKAGKYPSVRAAAKAAGLVKTASALDLLQRTWQKASPEQREAFLAWLKEQP